MTARTGGHGSANHCAAPLRAIVPIVSGARLDCALQDGTSNQRLCTKQLTTLRA